MEFVALSGLPRTGSTLLSAILSQNPDIHAEGNSAVCQLMWDMQFSCETNSSQQLKGSYREDLQDALVAEIPKIYYKNIKKSIVVDKCRSWTLPSNIAMIRRYITDKPKVLVMVRPIDEIVDSFEKLHAKNNLPLNKEMLLTPNTEPLMRSYEGVNFARAINQGEFFFIEYQELINNPRKVLDSIYDFCEWKKFEHDFDNVVNKYPENDEVYGLIGMHKIYPKVGLKEND